MKPCTFLAFLLLLVPAMGQQSATTCLRNVSFAVAEGGQVASRAPHFTEKWIKKNSSKYPGLCFSQSPDPSSANFAIVFATSQAAFDGIYPTVRSSTATSTSPLSGTGTITTNYGSTWNYSYNGTLTTTTTTTYQANLPYSDTTTGLFAYVYDERGALLSRESRQITTRQGGDTYNTLGYNVGAALGSIHIRERLLKAAIKDVMR